MDCVFYDKDAPDRHVSPNIALGKPATQSTTFIDFNAANAVDGNRGTDVGVDKCTYTNHGDRNPWWRVDLQAVYTITSVRILNRGKNKYGDVSDLLHDVTVTVGLTEYDVNTPCGFFAGPGTVSQLVVIDCPTLPKGRFVKISKTTRYLILSIRTGNLVAADKIRDAKSALECKLIGNTVTNTPQWRDEADDVMEKILCAKIDQLKEMNDLLASSRPHTIFAHSVYDLYWGTGLDSEKTAHTAPDAWPGQNKFGKLLQRLADKRRTKPRSVSMSRAVKTRQQGIDKYTC
uniref:Fucolectin n=1 Tax=Magallana gigas TaxID=29159 RepID=K1QHZ2_MAGGI